MGYESIFQYGKERVEKQRGFKNFGVAFGVISLIVTILSVAGLFVLPLFFNCANVIEVFSSMFSANSWQYLVYAIIVLMVIVGTIAYAIASAVKMLKGTSQKSGNVGFEKPSLFAFLTYSVVGEWAVDFGIGTDLNVIILRYALIAVMLIRVIYNFAITVNNDRYFSKVHTKLTGPVVISLIASVVSIVAVVLTVGIVSFFEYEFVSVYIGSINSMVGGSALSAGAIISIIRPIIILVLAVSLISGIFGLVLNLFKFSFDKNYLRGSSYFSKTAPYNAPLGAAILLLVLCVLPLIEAGAFSFSYLITPPAIYALVGFVVVLVLTIIYAVLIAKDKREVVYGIDACALPENVATQEQEETANLLPLASETEEEPVEEIVEEPVEEIIEEPVIEEQQEEIEEIIEEPVVEEKQEPAIIEEKKEEPAAQSASPAPAPAQPVMPVNAYGYAQPPVAPYGYPQAPYAPYPYPPYPYFMPYPVVQQAPAPQAPAPAPQPTIICIPYGAPASQAPVQAPVSPAPAPAPVQEVVAPVQVPVQAPVEEEIEEENAPFAIVKKTLEEKIAELPAQMKKFYKQIATYAGAKEGVKVNKATYAESVFFGRDCIIKIQIKQGKIVCSFSLVNFEVKSMLKNGKAREQLTVVKIVDANTLNLAKQSVDMAYKLAVEAKAERHREQLRKRREARQAKKQ